MRSFGYKNNAITHTFAESSEALSQKKPFLLISWLSQAFCHSDSKLSSPAPYLVSVSTSDCQHFILPTEVRRVLFQWKQDPLISLLKIRWWHLISQRIKFHAFVAVTVIKKFHRVWPFLGLWLNVQMFLSRTAHTLVHCCLSAYNITCFTVVFKNKTLTSVDGNRKVLLSMWVSFCNDSSYESPAPVSQ